MNKPLTALAAAGLMIAFSGQAAAKPVHYEGTTHGGFAISFERSGAKISKINTLVPTTCVPAGSGTPRSGGDAFRPPGAFRFGTTRKVKAKQDSALHYSKVTKNYKVTMKRGKRGKFSGVLHVNYSFQALGYDAFSNPRLEGYVCQGDDRFSGR